MDNKLIYVVTDNSIVDGEVYYSIAGVADSEEQAKEIFHKAVENVKKISNFDSLEAINISDKLDNEYTSEWMYEESEDEFTLYLNGEYNDENYSVQIKKFELNKYLEKEDSYEL